MSSKFISRSCFTILYKSVMQKKSEMQDSNEKRQKGEKVVIKLNEEKEHIGEKI